MKIVVSAICVLLTNLLFAQVTQWKTFDSSNVALPSNIIISIAVDDDNMKWVGTYSGLVKTDGDTWETYNTGNSGLPDDVVRGVAIDNANNVWVATLNGIAKFDGANWEVFYEDTTGSNPVEFLCISVGTGGDIYAGSESNGLFWYDGANWVNYNTSNSSIPQNRIESIAFKGSDVLWLGTNSQGIVNATLGGSPTFVAYNTQNSTMPFDFVKTVTVGPEGVIWAGTGSDLPDSGLVSINPQTTAITVYDEATTGIAFDKVWAITFEDTVMYVGTNDTVLGFARLDTAWAVYDFGSDGLASDYVYSIAVDDSAYKWIGTFKGISVYSEDGVFVSVNETQTPAISVKAYPQPATDRVMFAVNLSHPEQILVEIYSLEGNLIDKRQVNLSGNNVIEYNTGSLAQGMYIARFSGKGYIQPIKFIISPR